MSTTTYSIEVLNTDGKVVDTVRQIPTYKQAVDVARGEYLYSPIGFTTRIVPVTKC